MTDFNQNESDLQTTEKTENKNTNQTIETKENDTADNNIETEKKKKNYDRKNVQSCRHIIQLISFFLFPALFITIFYSFRDIVSAISHGNFHPTTLSTQLVLTIGILLITILWGRFFCGYLCSFGAISDLLYYISEKIFPNKPKIPPSIDKWLKWLKYAILIFFVVGVWILSLSFSASFSPWSAFGILISGNLIHITTVFATIGFFLLIAIAIGSFFIERFFCRYLCPLGAIFAAISKKRFFKIRRNTDTCTDCTNCSRHCSMGIEIHKKDTIVSGECIDCMKCISACPNSCFESKPDPVITGTASAIVIAGLVTAANILPDSSIHRETHVNAEQNTEHHNKNFNHEPGTRDQNDPNFQEKNKNFRGRPHFNEDDNSNDRSYHGKKNDNPNGRPY